MNKLFEFGISEDDIRCMLGQVPSIAMVSDADINFKIDILTYLGCVDRHIKNILISNPYCLDRSNSDLVNLIKYLIGLGFTNLNLLFDSNPYFLNYDVFEIKNYFDKRMSKGISLEDIVNEITDNPYIIDEE